MDWLEEVLLIDDQTVPMTPLNDWFDSKGITLHRAATQADARQSHAKYPIDLILYPTGHKTTSFTQATPDVLVRSIDESDTVDEVIDHVKRIDAAVADQTEATFIHPTGNTQTTAPTESRVVNYGAAEKTGVHIGRAVDLADWVYENGVEIVASDRRGDVKTAFTVTQHRKSPTGMETFCGTPDF